MGLARQKWGDGVEYGYLEQVMALCLKIIVCHSVWAFVCDYLSHFFILMAAYYIFCGVSLLLFVLFRMRGLGLDTVGIIIWRIS
jgi:hypothetical protein